MPAFRGNYRPQPQQQQQQPFGRPPSQQFGRSQPRPNGRQNAPNQPLILGRGLQQEGPFQPQTPQQQWTPVNTISVSPPDGVDPTVRQDSERKQDVDREEEAGLREHNQVSYPYTCFGFKDKECVVHGDWSFEEWRLAYYNARRANKMAEYELNLKQRTDDLARQWARLATPLAATPTPAPTAPPAPPASTQLPLTPTQPTPSSPPSGQASGTPLTWPETDRPEMPAKYEIVLGRIPEIPPPRQTGYAAVTLADQQPAPTPQNPFSQQPFSQPPFPQQPFSQQPFSQQPFSQQQHQHQQPAQPRPNGWPPIQQPQPNPFRQVF